MRYGNYLLLIIWNNGKMTKWTHNFFLIRAVDGGRTGRARNLKICRDTVDSLRNLNQDRDRRQGIEMNNESINHKQEDIIIINYVRR